MRVERPAAGNPKHHLGPGLEPFDRLPETREGRRVILRRKAVHLLHGEGTRGLPHLQAQGMAVEAVEVAPGGDGDAEVLDHAPVVV